MVLDFLPPDVIGFLAVFLFVFALVYALMVYANLFKESKKAVVIIAIVIGLVTAVYEPAVTVITQFIPVAAVVLIFLFFIIFVKKIFEKKGDQKTDLWPAMIGMGIMLILLSVFWDRVSVFIGIGAFSADLVLWIIGLLLIILILVASYSMWGEEK